MQDRSSAPGDRDPPAAGPREREDRPHGAGPGRPRRRRQHGRRHRHGGRKTPGGTR